MISMSTRKEDQTDRNKNLSINTSEQALINPNKEALITSATLPTHVQVQNQIKKNDE